MFTQRPDFRPKAHDYDKSTRLLNLDDNFDCTICLVIRRDVLACSICNTKACRPCLVKYGGSS